VVLAMTFASEVQAAADAWTQALVDGRNSRFSRNYARAESHATQALQIAEASPEPQKSVRKYESLSLLGAIYEDQAKYELAEDRYLKALKILQASTGEDSDLTVSAMGNLARLYLAQKMPEKAINLYDQELSIRSRIYGESSPRLTGALIKMARTQLEYKQYEKAERHYLRAVAIFEKSGGPRNPALRPPFEALAKICEATGRKADAANFAKRAAAIPD